MSGNRDESERKPDNPESDTEGATGDSGSPTASPRDKKTRLQTTQGETSVPVTPGRTLGAQNLLVAASPPKFINVRDVMQLANGVTDMALAHEIAIGSEFRLEQIEANPESLEGRIKEVMHKAFWDSLAESLREDPPDYTHALVLLKEVKESLLELLLPHQQRLRASIEEVLDLELISQQADHGTLDFRRYAAFVVDKMAAFCAPVRDQLIASLRDVDDVITLYRKIFDALSLMKLDMVNFTIAQFRPLVQQHSVDYEKQKFKSLLDIQKENGVDGLQFTRAWLARSADRVKPTLQSTAESAASIEPPAASTSSDTSSAAPPVSSAAANAILNAAFLELLDWDDDRAFPETLLIDQQRFMELREQVRWLTLVTSVLMVTYGSVGPAISGLSELKSTLTSQISILTRNVPADKLAEAVAGVAEQLSKQVNTSLADRGFPVMTATQEQLMKGQVCAVVEPHNAVYTLMSQYCSCRLLPVVIR